MQIDLDSNWRNSSGEIDGRPAHVRCNEGLKTLLNTDYSQELIVSLVFKEPTEQGMPATDELDIANQFEDAVRPLLQAEMESVLAVVITNDGYRDFVFYTRDIHNAIGKLQSIQPSFSHLQVEVTGGPDPHWTRFRQFATET